MMFFSSNDMISILRDTMIASVREDRPDLSPRQLAVFLICYLQETAQTVRGLAQLLNISKPAITRALDRLCELDLVKRKTDPLDKRSILVQRTISGQNYLYQLHEMMNKASLKNTEYS